jgi:ParB-like chromosome segregation protein Spo0J
MALRPMVIDESGMVLGGNQRLKAIKSLGLKEIPDAWVMQAKDLTEEQRRRFILVDNNIPGMSGEFDFDALSQEWQLPELEDLGFSMDDFNAAVEINDIPEENKQIDEEAMAETENECPKCGFKW